MGPASIVGRLRRRLRGMVRPDAVRAEVVEDNVRAGMAPTEARMDAERRFGPFPVLLEEGFALRGGTTILARPSAFMPVLMSMTAVAVVALHVLRYGGAREVDEGTSAHVWQMLVGLQVPIVAWFGARWLPRAPAKAVLVLILQAVALLAALAPVYMLGL
jgi:hypothetical protein